VIALVFGSIYFAIVYPDPAATDMSSFGQAIIASLQIQSTVGFAAPAADHWARNWKIVLTITFHSLVTVLFNIFLLGTLFARLSSAKNRAITVKLSNKAVIISDDSKAYPNFVFRIGEIRRHQLLNLNISAYLFHHESEEKLFIRERLSTTPSTGIFLAVPTEIKHVIDESSPLWKFICERSDLGVGSGNPKYLSDYSCTVCGDSFTTRQQLSKHLTFNKNAQHLRFNADVVSMPAPTLMTVRKSLVEISAKTDIVPSYFELIVLVEGTEPVTGSPIQIRHSYTMGDIVFGAQFASCWRVEDDLTGKIARKKIVVNFDLFNKIEY